MAIQVGSTGYPALHFLRFQQAELMESMSPWSTVATGGHPGGYRAFTLVDADGPSLWSPRATNWVGTCQGIHLRRRHRVEYLKSVNLGL